MRQGEAVPRLTDLPPLAWVGGWKSPSISDPYLCLLKADGSLHSVLDRLLLADLLGSRLLLDFIQHRFGPVEGGNRLHFEDHVLVVEVVLREEVDVWARLGQFVSVVAIVFAASVATLRVGFLLLGLGEEHARFDVHEVRGHGDEFAGDLW